MRLLAPITSLRPRPWGRRGLVERLRLTIVSAGYALAAIPALPLAILVVVAVPLGLVAVGLLLALLVVPATAALIAVHRHVGGALLDEELRATYADTSDSSTVGRPVRWLRDGARWRDVGLLWFSATGGFVLSLVPVLLVAAPIVHLIGLAIDPSWVWVSLLAASGLGLVVWWFTTPALVRARAATERAILVGSRVAELERRVEEIAESRSETLDSSAAEVRRIERDLHDGAQARMAAVGMTVGLAETLLRTDPEGAAILLGEARQTTLDALDDLRSVVRGIHPPVLTDRGLAGGIEALALALPLPVTVSIDVAERLAAPLESAAYFAVAECLANTVKHSGATRAYVTGDLTAVRLRLVVGDDGTGGADEHGAGLTGVARRVGAFDGTLHVDSPPGGPTAVAVEIPCPT